MKKAFNKDVARSITRSLGRFLAIAGIVALGTGFYAGLRMTAPDMKLSADLFYDGTQLMDLRVLSTLGLTDDDLDALRAVDDVEGVMGSYETDVMATINGEQFAVRVHSLPSAALDSDTSDGTNAFSSDADYLNRPLLVEGDWPRKQGECALSADIVMGTPLSVGDTITLIEGVQDVDETLATHTYTLVGLISSSYYATSSNLGTTSLGSGTIQQIMYVPKNDFSSDLPYTEVFLTVRGASGEFASGSAYEQLIDAATAKIEDLAPKREQARVDELRADAQVELDDAQSEYEQQKADAEVRLDEAKAELDKAATTLAESGQELAAGEDEYDAGTAELWQQRASTQSQLDDAQAQITEGQAQLDKQGEQLDSAKVALDNAWAQWNQQATTLAQQWQGWHAQFDTLYETRDSLQASIDNLEDEIHSIEAIDPSDARLVGLRQQLVLAQQQLQAFLQDNATNFATADQMRAQLESGDTQLADSKNELDNQQASYDQGKSAYDAGVSELARLREELQSSRDEASSRFAAAEAQLRSADAQLQSGAAQLEEGKSDYEAGLAEYEGARADAQAELDDAKRTLDDAQQAIDDLENPTWYIMSRDQNYGVVSFESDADRVDSIASVFPFIFFLVAALVALTTMTRMVEEERVLIGTYKALGYSRWRIASKYLLYAAIASITGSVIGIAVLSQVLPTVIQQAYSIIYFVPQGPHPIDWGLAGLAAGLGVGITLVATWAAAFATLRERPALLMLPRAPKAGKRILLERVRPLWRRLSFSWKVTFRNLFRYKKRFVMTMVGIAGCTALLLTGLGLSDAINDIIEKQFHQIMRYNTTVVTEDDITSADKKQLDELLADTTYVSDSTRILRVNMVASTPAGGDINIHAVVPQSPSEFAQLFLMRTRIGHTPVELDQDGVVLSEKLASELGVDVGDSIELSEQDEMGNATGLRHALVVTGVIENYIYHYVFLGPTVYEDVWDEQPNFESVFAVATTDAETRARFGEEMRAIEGVKTVAFNDETIETYESMLSSVNLIVVVLVVAAAALAFIVLYNLTNINITERQREIATLKVLGFTPHEVDSYIYRETALLSFIGCLVGLVLGMFMESFVVVTAEVNQVMFGREIHVTSFVVAFLLTMLFTLLVMLAMRHKLARVNMVESLKSNE